MTTIEIPAAPLPAAFTEWLARHVDDATPIGDLARVVAKHGGDAAALRLRCERESLATWGQDMAPSLRELPAELVGDVLTKAECAVRLADGDQLEDAGGTLELFDTAWREWTRREAAGPLPFRVTAMTFGEDGGLLVTGVCACGETHTLPAWVSRFGAEDSLPWTMATPCVGLAMVSGDLDDDHEEWLASQLTEWVIEVTR